MEAFFFGDAARPLFGARHEPTRAPRQTAVLLCPSWGMEYMRTYRLMFMLAEALARRGFETLRFDYSCTGDSAGYSNEASVSQWIADIGRATRELRELSGCRKLCLLGLRLGAALATESVSKGLNVDALVVWDLPATGQSWIDELQAIDVQLTAHKNRYRAVGSKLSRCAPDEMLGMPLPDQLQMDLCGLNTVLSTPAGQTLAIQSAGVGSVGQSESALTLPEAPEWNTLDRVDRPWIPVQSIEIIANRLDRWLS